MLFVAPSLKSSPSGVLPSVACSHAPQRVDKAPGTLGPSAPAALAAAAITVAQRRHHQRRKKTTAVKAKAAAAEAAVKEELPLPPGKPGNAMMDLFK